jgi:hypothetical protein
MPTLEPTGDEPGIPHQRTCTPRVWYLEHPVEYVYGDTTPLRMVDCDCPGGKWGARRSVPRRRFARRTAIPNTGRRRRAGRRPAGPAVRLPLGSVGVAVTPWLYVTTDPDHGRALIRGEGMADVIRLLIARKDAVFSRSARGWVIPLRLVPDVEAYGQLHHLLVVVHDRKEVA